jgi:catalase
MVELVAPRVGGVTLGDGKPVAAQQKVNGGPSVLYDAVVVLASTDGATLLSREATAKDFVSDAFAHAKFIGVTAAARPLLEKAGVGKGDAGVLVLKTPADARTFVAECRKLRFWEREVAVHAV